MLNNILPKDRSVGYSIALRALGLAQHVTRTVLQDQGSPTSPGFYTIDRALGCSLSTLLGIASTCPLPRFSKALLR